MPSEPKVLAPCLQSAGKVLAGCEAISAGQRQCAGGAGGAGGYACGGVK